MYIYDIQSDKIHRNHPKHSNLENRWFPYIIWAKSPKIAEKNDHSIAIFSILFNRSGIFYMVHGESSGPKGSKYV